MLEANRFLTAEQFLALRKEGGRWLYSKRLACGLSQRQLQLQVAPNSPRTIVSLIENGRLSIPPERYEDWAQALNLDSKHFTQIMIKFYDPILYRIIFTTEGVLRPLINLNNTSVIND